MKVDIFYKSYSKDFQWLYYSLQSIKKFVVNYNQIVIVIPERDNHLFDYNQLIPKTTVILVDEQTKTFKEGYLFQQWVKMSAHLYCKGDFIMYADSDLIFKQPVDVNKIIKDKKPEILYTPYSQLGDAICWKEPTDRFMNSAQDFEFMRRLPLIYHKSTIEILYNLVPNLKDIIMNSDKFSEFNAIGAWAFAHEKHKYSFVNTDDWAFVENYTEQFWSHSGLTENDRNKIKSILE